MITLFLGTLLTTMQAATMAPIGPGVSEALASERRAAFQDVRYDLRVIVPSNRKESVRGRVAVRLNLKAPHRVVFDFAQPPDRITNLAGD